MNDPRTDRWQMAKMTARLQAATTSGKPVLLRVDYAGARSATRTQALEQRADEWSFLLWQFGVPEFQPPKP
jgi:prolyl oligopeptidase